MLRRMACRRAAGLPQWHRGATAGGDVADGPTSAMSAAVRVRFDVNDADLVPVRLVLQTSYSRTAVREKSAFSKGSETTAQKRSCNKTPVTV